MKISLSDYKSVKKSWGLEVVLFNEDCYCLKLLFFNNQSKGSFHYHKIKTETFYLVEGSVTVRHIEDTLPPYRFSERCVDETTLSISEGFHCKPGTLHQIVAHKESVVLEVSTHHQDSDTYRQSNEHNRQLDSQKMAGEHKSCSLSLQNES